MEASYAVKAGWGDTNLPPGGQGQLFLYVRNVGQVTGSSPMTIVDRLPAGVMIESIEWMAGSTDLSYLCGGIGTGELTCTVPARIVEALAPAPGAEPGFTAMPTGQMPPIYLNVSVGDETSAVGTNFATVAGGGAPESASDVQTIRFSSSPSAFGVVPGSFDADLFSAAFPSQNRSRQAGDHPFELRVAFDLTEESGVDSHDHLRYTFPHGALADADVSLPQGLVGNPEALPHCSPLDFAQLGTTVTSTQCPPDTQVGYINIWPASGTTDHGQGGLDPSWLTRVPLYNVTPPTGVPMDFAFDVDAYIQGHIYPKLDPARNYSLGVVMPNLSSQIGVRGAEVTLWGVPGDPAHDRFRYFDGPAGTNPVLGAPFGPEPIRPLLTNPMDCGTASDAARISVDSYNRRAQYTPVQEAPSPDQASGCTDPRIRFTARVSAQPTSDAAGSATGLDLRVAIPLRDDEVAEARELYAENGYVKGISTPPAKKVLIELPEGMTASPSAAQGLTSCSPSEIGLDTERPASCPEGSTLGSATVLTPILSSPLQGYLYLAEPYENPFGSLFAAYVLVEGSGIRIKLPVRIDLDPGSGQVRVILDHLPQLPVSEIQLRLKSGPRALLRTPDACGTYMTKYSVTSWADADPVKGTSPFALDEACDETGGFHMAFSAGTTDNTAGKTSPFSLELIHGDREQDPSSFTASLPPGLVADFASVRSCPTVLTAAGDCPPDSRIGSATIATGSGPFPLWIPQPGKPPAAIYLAGPYQGAPYSLLVKVPAQAGPFDLGTLVERAAIYVDPNTAQASLHFDALTQIVSGIPLDYGAIRLRIDRPDFIRNPTSCEPMQISATASSTGGDTANLAERFQAADCAALPFRPTLALYLYGGLARNAHPALHAVLRAGVDQADIAAAAFTLPAGELLDIHRIRALCARGLPPERCPGASRLGYARLWSPVLAGPLEGPIFLREPSSHLPDLLADLRYGQLRLLLHGRAVASGGHLGIRFSGLPDLPLARALFTFAGGRNGVLVNSEALCPRPRRATALLSAHSGKRRRLRSLLQLRGRC